MTYQPLATDELFDELCEQNRAAILQDLKARGLGRNEEEAGSQR